MLFGQKFVKFWLTVIIHRSKWCIGQQIRDPGKLQYMLKKLYVEIKSRRTTLEKDEESF